MECGYPFKLNSLRPFTTQPWNGCVVRSHMMWGMETPSLLANDSRRCESMEPSNFISTLQRFQAWIQRLVRRFQAWTNQGSMSPHKTKYSCQTVPWNYLFNCHLARNTNPRQVNKHWKILLTEEGSIDLLLACKENSDPFFNCKEEVLGSFVRVPVSEKTEAKYRATHGQEQQSFKRGKAVNCTVVSCLSKNKTTQNEEFFFHSSANGLKRWFCNILILSNLPN